MFTRIQYKTHKISNDLLNAFLSSVNTLSGSFERDIVTACARAREANSYTAIFLRQLSQHLPSPTDEVTVMPGVHDHTVLYHVILKRKDRWTAGSAFKETLTQIFYFLICHTRFLMRVSSSFCASHTASSLPMMVMFSCSGSSGDGKMIRAPVRSRTRRILAPPLPIRNLWYSGLAWISTEKLLTCWCDKKWMSYIEWMPKNF